MLLLLPVVPIQCGPGAFVLWIIFVLLSMDVSKTLRIWQLKVRFCRASLAVCLMVKKLLLGPQVMLL